MNVKQDLSYLTTRDLDDIKFESTSCLDDVKI